MPGASQLQTLMLIGLICLLAIVGVLVIVGLGSSWRRAGWRSGRFARRRPKPARYVDAWSEAGRRAPDVSGMEEDAPDRHDDPDDGDADDAGSNGRG